MPARIDVVAAGTPVLLLATDLPRRRSPAPAPTGARRPGPAAPRAPGSTRGSAGSSAASADPFPDARGARSAATAPTSRGVALHARTLNEWSPPSTGMSVARSPELLRRRRPGGRGRRTGRAVPSTKSIGHVDPVEVLVADRARACRADAADSPGTPTRPRASRRRRAHRRDPPAEGLPARPDRLALRPRVRADVERRPPGLTEDRCRVGRAAAALDVGEVEPHRRHPLDR